MCVAVHELLTEAVMAGFSTAVAVQVLHTVVILGVHAKPVRRLVLAEAVLVLAREASVLIRTAEKLGAASEGFGRETGFASGVCVHGLSSTVISVGSKQRDKVNIAFHRVHKFAFAVLTV